MYIYADILNKYAFDSLKKMKQMTNKHNFSKFRQKSESGIFNNYCAELHISIFATNIRPAGAAPSAATGISNIIRR